MKRSAFIIFLAILVATVVVLSSASPALAWDGKQFKKSFGRCYNDPGNQAARVVAGQVLQVTGPNRIPLTMAFTAGQVIGCAGYGAYNAAQRRR